MRVSLIFVTLMLGASSEAATITEAGLILETPSPWQKEDLQGEDSYVVRYHGDGFTCEIEEGGALLLPKERARAELDEIGKKQHDQTLCAPGESVAQFGDRLGLISISREDRFIQYGGFADLAQLYFPLADGGYVVVRLFYGAPATRESALRVLRSAKWAETEPNQRAEPTRGTSAEKREARSQYCARRRVAHA